MSIHRASGEDVLFEGVLIICTIRCVLEETGLVESKDFPNVIGDGCRIVRIWLIGNRTGVSYEIILSAIGVVLRLWHDSS